MTKQFISVVSYNVYGTYKEGKYIEERCQHIIDEIFKHDNPDVICLQEATEIVIETIIKRNPIYKIWTKLDTITTTLIPEHMEDLNTNGYMVILSKHDFIEQKVVYEGTRYNKGIMKVKININNTMITIYNVHMTGGTFGKPYESVMRKKLARINELAILTSSLQKEDTKDIIIMGDFNYDSNNISQDETYKSPEYLISECKDIWTLLRPNDLGATEDEIINTFRSCMKIKERKDKRECRYDKIISIMKNIRPINIDIIGNIAIDITVMITGKDMNNNIYTNMCKLFPSDHFGLYCLFEIK